MGMQCAFFSAFSGVEGDWGRTGRRWGNLCSLDFVGEKVLRRVLRPETLFRSLSATSGLAAPGLERWTNWLFRRCWRRTVEASHTLL